MTVQMSSPNLIQFGPLVSAKHGPWRWPMKKIGLGRKSVVMVILYSAMYWPILLEVSRPVQCKSSVERNG